MKMRLRKKKETETTPQPVTDKKWSRKPRSRRRKIGTVLVVAVVAATTGTTIGYHYLYASQEAGTEYKEVQLQSGDLSLDFSSDGTTQISTVAQKPEFNATAVTLTVEEVYVASGDTVEEGAKLLKITDDSYAEAVAYYEDAIADAKETLTTAQDSYDVGVLEAKYTLETTNAAAASADATYQASLAELDQKVADKKSELETAQAQIATYTNNLANNTYYTDNQVDEKNTAKTTASKAVDAAQKIYDSANITYAKVSKTVADEVTALTTTNKSTEEIQAAITQLQADYKTLTEANTALEKASSDLEKAKSELSKAEQEATQAESSYEQAVKDATQKKEQLENNLPTLQSDYETALRDAVTDKVDIQNTYDVAVTDGEYAQTVYDSTVSSLKSAVDSAKDSLDDLTKEQSNLLAMENGVVTAAQAGTVASVSYEAEDTLAKDTAFVDYYDTDTIMISVEVPQEDMQYISVGDTMNVAITGVRGAGQTGTISSIATAATTDGSASNVTYAVVVTVDNSDGSISTGLSATVTFFYGELSDVYYIESDAVSNVSGDSAVVKQYDNNGDVISVPVTIGDSTDQYIVITEGISEGDTCLVEVGGEQE